MVASSSHDAAATATQAVESTPHTGPTATGAAPPSSAAAPAASRSLAPPPASSSRSSSSCSAGFSLRVATANVCCFPLLTRNKTAVAQFCAGWIMAIALLRWATITYAPSIPLSIQLVLLPLLALPLLNFVIPLQASVVWLLSRGTWHDHKAARLRLLLGSLDSLDCVALQELYSSSVDARYRDMVLHEASLRGFHYAVPVSRVPRLPAVLLNAGTLILSRYAISHSASIVFPTKAFYDLVIVNRGASWARIQLPTGHVLHFFTCHLAPPLNEVAGRAGRLLLKLQCPQQKQIRELIEFMQECIQPDRDAWEQECAEAAAARLDGSAPASPSGPPRARPFSVILAGDFNLDCGSLRYFSLLHALHSLHLGMRDLFASEEEEDGADAGRCLRHHHPHGPAAAAAVLHQGGELDRPGQEEHDGDEQVEAVEEEEEGANKGDKGPSRRRQCGTGTTASATSAPSAAAAASPSSPTTPSRLLVAPNSWNSSSGNGREPYSPELHAPYSAVMRSPRLHWQATFGQLMTPPGGESRAATAAGQPTSASPAVVHQETFLTHASLLGSHSTHDYIFSSLRPRATAVEPFLAPHALHRLLHHPDRQECHHRVGDDERADAAEAAAALADMYEGSSASSGMAATRGARVPPYQQLSDHCALLATLMLPEESAAMRSRASSRVA